MRIGVVGMFHETNTFALEHNDRTDADVRIGSEIIERAHPRDYVGGFLEGVRQPEVDVVPTVQVRFVHGGLVHANVFEHYVAQIQHSLEAAGPLDGVFFALHGAMAAEDPYTDAEGHLLREARKVLPHIPFVATYDFHGIMSPEECEELAAAFPNDTNPHIDSYERGIEAAECLVRIVRGEIHPVTRIVHVPIIGPNIGQSTWSHIPEEERRLPLYQLNQMRAEMEQTPGVINITIMGGYGYADTPHSCMSVIVTTDGDRELADQTARRLADEVWAMRQDILTVRPIVAVDEGVEEAIKRPESPIVLVDLGDDPGSSCAADSPAVLESLIRHNAADCVLTLRDPKVVGAGIAAGVGGMIDMEAGAAIDSRFYHPIRIQGKVKLIDDGVYMICGPTHGGWGRDVNRESRRRVDVGTRVVVRLANNVDVIFSQQRTGKDRDFFKSAGTLFEEKKIVVVKSNQAHRASFDPIVAASFNLASPGASTVDYLSLPFRHIPRPIWPIDRDFEWSAFDENR